MHMLQITQTLIPNLTHNGVSLASSYIMDLSVCQSVCNDLLYPTCGSLLAEEGTLWS